MFQQVFLGHREHPARAAGRVVDRLDDMAFAQVSFWCQQQTDHQADYLTRSEVLSGFFVGLFSPNTDEFLKDITHLHVIYTLHRQVYTSKRLDDFIQQVLFIHTSDVVAEPETLNDLLDIL